LTEFGTRTLELSALGILILKDIGKKYLQTGKCR